MHRDLKPSNVFFDQNNNVKLIKILNENLEFHQETDKGDIKSCKYIDFNKTLNVKFEWSLENNLEINILTINNIPLLNGIISNSLIRLLSFFKTVQGGKRKKTKNKKKRKKITKKNNR